MSRLFALIMLSLFLFSSTGWAQHCPQREVILMQNGDTLSIRRDRNNPDGTAAESYYKDFETGKIHVDEWEYADRKLQLERGKTLEDGEWTLTFIKHYTYNAEGLLIRTHGRYRGDSSSKEYRYADTLLVEETTIRGDTVSYRETHSYDAKGNRILTETDSRHCHPICMLRQERTFDRKGRLRLMRVTDSNGSASEHRYRYSPLTGRIRFSSFDNFGSQKIVTHFRRRGGRQIRRRVRENGQLTFKARKQGDCIAFEYREVDDTEWIQGMECCVGANPEDSK